MQRRSKGIISIFVMMLGLFIIFLIFATYSIKLLKNAGSQDMDRTLDSENAPIGVISITGAIMDSKQAIEELLSAEENDKIKAIILRIDSPGGAVGPTQEIYEEIRRIDKDKPIYASFGSIAASGGYYLGAATRYIYSNPGALTGSIGVIMQFADLSELFQFAKVKPQIIKAGKYKDIGSPNRSMTIEEKALMDKMINIVHDQFINDIVKVRGKRIKGDIREHAQGQIFSGEEALKLGLVDEMGGLYQAARSIHKDLVKNKKTTAPFGIKYIKKKKKFELQDLLEDLDETKSFIKGIFNQTRAPLFIYQ